MFQKRQLPFVSPDRRHVLPTLGTLAIEPVGNAEHSTGFFVYFHADGAAAATHGYIHFQLKFGAISNHPHWVARPVSFGIAEGTAELDRLIAATRSLIEGIMAANPLTHYYQVAGAVAAELWAERRRAALSWKTPTNAEQARVALMRRLEASLRNWTKSWQAKDAPTIASILDAVLEPQRTAA